MGEGRVLEKWTKSDTIHRGWEGLGEKWESEATEKYLWQKDNLKSRMGVGGGEGSEIGYFVSYILYGGGEGSQLLTQANNKFLSAHTCRQKQHEDLTHIHIYTGTVHNPTCPHKATQILATVIVSYYIFLTKIR